MCRKRGWPWCRVINKKGGYCTFSITTNFALSSKTHFWNFLTLIPTYVYQTCEKQISQRNENQSIFKIQEQTDFVETAKSTALEMHYSLLVFYLQFITHDESLSLLKLKCWTWWIGLFTMKIHSKKYQHAYYWLNRYWNNLSPKLIWEWTIGCGILNVSV